MKAFSIYLFGQLATHRRSRILQDMTGADICMVAPEAGMCLMFGNDYQKQAEAGKQQWADWCSKPGHSLLLLPPFEQNEIGLPTDWEIEFCDSPPSTNVGGLARILAGEVQFELKGSKIQVDAKLAHSWDDYTLNTGFYKKHVNSGLFAATTLPIWSITVTDYRDALMGWLSDLHENAGKPAKIDKATDSLNDIILDNNHYALLVHLYGHVFNSKENALNALQDSIVFQLDYKIANKKLDELEALSIAEGGTLTEAGIDLLRKSPYLSYAKALKEANNDH